MKTKWTLLLAAALLAGACLPADAAPRTISVTGTGTASAEANQAEFTVTVESSADTQQAAVSDNAARMRGLRAALLQTGARLDELTTQNYTVNPLYRYDGSRRENEGYRAANTLRVRVPRTALTGFLIDAAAENGADRIDSLQFRQTEAGPYRTQAIAAAAADARRKAEALAASLGATLGPVLTVSESAPSPVYFPHTAVLMSKAEGAGRAVTPVEGGEQTVSVSLSVTYELI